MERARLLTANLRTKILHLRGFDSSRISILSGGILMSIGNVSNLSRVRSNLSRSRASNLSRGREIERSTLRVLNRYADRSCKIAPLRSVFRLIRKGGSPFLGLSSWVWSLFWGILGC